MIRESKHTKGPWVAHILNNHATNPEFIIDCETTDTIAYGPRWDKDHHNEAIANARLIAAAPTMLEACIEARRIIERQVFKDAALPKQPLLGELNLVHAKLSDAIANARGIF
jgi:hypothetical protein